MSGCAPACASQTGQPPKTRTYGPGSIPKFSTVTPGGYGNLCFGPELSQPLVIQGTNRICYDLEGIRIGGPISKKIVHDQSAVSPSLREPYASPKSGIVRITIRGRRI